MPDFAVSAAIRAVDKFSATLHGIGNAVGRFGTQGAEAFDRVNKKASLFKSILGGVVVGNLLTMGIQKVGQGLREMAQALPEFADRGEQIGRTAKMLGLSADAYQRLAYAAKLTDTPTEALEGAMRKLNLAIGQGERGMGPLIKQMTRLSPQLAMQLRGARNADQAFMAVADAISRTTNVQARAAIVTAAFGKAGQQMLPMLLQGREGLMKLRGEASLYGTVLDDQAIAASERLAQSSKRLKGMVGSLKDQVLGFVVKAVTPYVEKALIWLSANKEIIATRIEDFITRTADALTQAGPAIAFFIKAVGFLISNWPLLGAVYLGWIAAQIALDAALDANPIGLITLAIEALIVEVLIVIRYWHEITSALEASWNWFNKLLANPWIKLSLDLLLEPLFLIASVIQTIIDLIQGKGIGAFRNLIKAAGPIGLIADMLGLTKTGMNAGNIAEQAPNKGMGAFQFINQVNVDNSRAPGTTSSVHTSQLPTGNPGYQYAGAQ
jgi:hypothetical protein